MNMTHTVSVLILKKRDAFEQRLDRNALRQTLAQSQLAFNTSKVVSDLALYLQFKILNGVDGVKYTDGDPPQNHEP